jgi:hypothetical protein
MVPDFVQLVTWVKRQPHTVAWPTHNPYACPVAAYLLAAGVPWCAVWRTGIETRQDYRILPPGHHLRRLIQRVELFPRERIHPDEVVTMARDLYRDAQLTDSERKRHEERKKDERIARLKHEWGW